MMPRSLLWLGVMFVFGWLPTFVAPAVALLQPLGTLNIAPIAVGSLNHFGRNDENDEVMKILKSVPPNTLIDTAELYGDGTTESVLGDCLKEAGRCWATAAKDDDGIYCGTKYAPSIFRRDPEAVVQACRNSIAKLQCQQIHLYQAHYSASLLPSLPLIGAIQDESVWEGLARCFEQGLVQNIGVCNYGPTLIRRAHAYFSGKNIPLVSNQINFNLMRASAAMETVEVCDELGISILAYHPLGKGTLTGTYDEMDPLTLRDIKGEYAFYKMKRWLSATIDLRAALSRISHSATTAAGSSRSIPQIAVNWVLRKKRTPIIGARTLEQAQDLLEASNWDLTDEQVAELDEAASLATSNMTVLGKEFKLV